MTPEQREELKAAAMKIADTNRSNESISAKEYTVVSEAFGSRATPNAILSLIAQVEALTVPQWISVEDGLPDEFEPVLFIWQGRIGIGETWTNNTGARGYKFNGASTFGDKYKPTRWMPLPAAPNIPAIPGTKEGA